MSGHTIRRRGQSRTLSAITATNALAAMYLVRRLGWNAADVFYNGTYCFSVRAEASGFWCILQDDTLSAPVDSLSSGFPERK